MTTTTIQELKSDCYELVGKEAAGERAKSIARELSNGASTKYNLSHKCVWEAAHTSIHCTVAAKRAREKEAERVSFAQVCATVEHEENPFLAMLLVSVWLFFQWLSLLVWLAPRAIAWGRATRQWTIAIANGYTKASYRLVHGKPFPSELPLTPMSVQAVVERLIADILPSLRENISEEVIICLMYARDFYLESAIRLLALLQNRYADKPFLLTAA